MALPFILLAWIPGLTKRLPRPGAWMDTFKQFLAFPLYITAVWLLWVAGRQTSMDVAAAVIRVGLIGNGAVAVEVKRKTLGQSSLRRFIRRALSQHQ